MREIYHYSSSKFPIIIGIIVVWLFLLTINILGIDLNKEFLADIFRINIIISICVLFYICVMLFFLYQTIYNGLIYLKCYKKESLIINNTDQILVYKTIINDETKVINVDFEDIYLIKKYKATYINLYYYEVFYTENDIVKKIVVSISLATNLEKKIKKKIKLIKEENIFCEKLPEPESWIK